MNLTFRHHYPMLQSEGTWAKNLCASTLNPRPRESRARRAKMKISPLRGQNFCGLWGGRFRRPLRNPLQNRSEDQVPAIPPVIPECVLIQIGLQIFLRNLVVDSADSPLYQTPESLNGVGVNIAHDPHLG